MFALCGVLFLALESAQSANLVVTSTEDSGAGSLRQAIADADSGDTITFESFLSGQAILLTNGQFTVTNNLSIDASALTNGIAIDGNANGRIFEFNSGTTNVLTELTLINGCETNKNGGAICVMSNAVLTISNSLLSNNTCGDYSPNYSGGAIANKGILTIISSTLSGNQAPNAGGIYNEGSLTIAGSMLSGNITEHETERGVGGAIVSFGVAPILVINNSTLTDNIAGSGGSIFIANGSLTINNSILSDNSAFTLGGGIWSQGLSTSTTINNSTLSGNINIGNPYGRTTYGGGVFNGFGSLLIINNSTLSGNVADQGGGIYNADGDYDSGTTLILTNTIVAGNTASTNSNIYGTIASCANNITNGVPLLAPLGDYGGSTQTMPPLEGSPAIDAGLNTGSLPATDQRGFPRLIGDAVDIGACEYGFEGCFITNTDYNGNEVLLEWSAFPMWEASIMYSTNLVTMPFTELTNGISYPVNSFTNAMYDAGNQCFYRVEIEPK